MKVLISLVLTLLCINLCYSQTEDSYWFTDVVEVKDFAQKHDVNILMVFAGSDWCKPCIQFKKEILESEKFKLYAEESLAVLYLDFPSKKKNKLSKAETEQNEGLADQFNKSGTFPKIVLLDSDLLKFLL